MRRLSNLTCGALLAFIRGVVGDDDPDDYDVWIGEFKLEVCIANRATGVGDSISAGGICYATKEVQ